MTDTPTNTVALWGWYSPRQAERTGTLHYEARGEQARPVRTVDGVPCVEVTMVSQGPAPAASWPDLVRTGPVGRYVRKGKPNLNERTAYEPKAILFLDELIPWWVAQ